MLLPDFDPAVLPEDQVPKALALVNAWQSQLIARVVTPSTTSTVTPEAENHDNLLTSRNARSGCAAARNGFIAGSRHCPSLARLDVAGSSVSRDCRSG